GPIGPNSFEFFTGTGNSFRRAIMDPMRITRRQALATSLLPLARAAAAPPPNIVFIIADDLGYADLSCYGRRDYTTPHIDRLAAGGVRFVQAYSNSPVCSATRTALMTGRYHQRLQIGLEEPLPMGSA